MSSTYHSFSPKVKKVVRVTRLEHNKLVKIKLSTRKSISNVMSDILRIAWNHSPEIMSRFVDRRIDMENKVYSDKRKLEVVVQYTTDYELRSILEYFVDHVPSETGFNGTESDIVRHIISFVIDHLNLKLERDYVERQWNDLLNSITPKHLVAIRKDGLRMLPDNETDFHVQLPYVLRGIIDNYIHLVPAERRLTRHQIIESTIQIAHDYDIDKLKELLDEKNYTELDHTINGNTSSFSARIGAVHSNMFKHMCDELHMYPSRLFKLIFLKLILPNILSIDFKKWDELAEAKTPKPLPRELERIMNGRRYYVK